MRFAAVVDTDLYNDGLALSRGFEGAPHYYIYVVIVGDEKITTFERIGKAAPVYMAETFIRCIFVVIK